LTTDTVRFNSATYTNQPNAGTTSIAGITVSGAGTLNISGTKLSIGTTGIAISAGSGATTISAATVAVGGNQSWTNSSSNLFNVTSAITNVGNTTPYTLTIAGSGSATLAGNISDGGTTGKIALTINTTGGTTTFSGANSYTGATTITAGNLDITGSSSGGGAITIGSGTATSTLTIDAGTGTVATSGVTLNTNGPSVLFLTSGTLLVGAGGITVNPNTVNNNTVFDFDGGTLKASSNFIFASNIPVVLTGNSVVDTNGFTITDNSFIGYSASLINGSTVTNSGGMTIQGGGTFIAGFYSGITGSLTVTGAGTTWRSSNYTSASVVSGLLTIGTGAFLDVGGEGVIAQGGFTGGGTVNNSGALATLDLDNATGSYNFSGTITGSVGVTKSSAGTQILSGTNTYSGATLVSGGNLQFAQVSALSNNTTSGTVNSGAMVTLNVGGAGEFNNGTSGTGSIGNVVASPFTFFNAGSTLGLDTTNATGTFAYAGNLGVNTNGTGLGLDKLGTGSLELTGANTYTGTTTVSVGTLQIGNGTSGSISNSSAAVINSGATLAFDEANGSTYSGAVTDNGFLAGAEGTGITNTLSGVISGTGAVSQTGAGTTILTGADTYTGATTASAGTLQVGNGTSGSISNSSASTVASGATLAFDEANGGAYSGTIANSGLVAGAEGTGITNTLGGVISGTGSFTQTGAGKTILTGADTYNGATVVSAGTVQVGNGTSGSISNSSTSTVTAGANMAFDEANGGSYTGAITNSGTISGAEGSGITNTLGGVISGTGAVIQTGAGTTILSNTDTYSGKTIVNAGTLKITGSANSTTGITVNTGGTLLFGASNAINNSATPIALAGGTLSMQGLTGATETMGALTLSGNSVIDFGTGNSNTLIFSSLSGLTTGVTLTVLDWTGNAYAAGSTTDTGSLTQDRLLFVTNPGLTSTQLSQILFYNDAGGLIGNGLDLSVGYMGKSEIAPVPEPSTIFGALCLLALLLWNGRRQINDYL
jgi:autotransporter-associated beta strand protein